MTNPTTYRLLLIGLGLSIAGFACNEDAALVNSGSFNGAGAGSGSDSGSTGSSSSSATTGAGPGSTTGSTGSGQGQAGVLTAGAWDDNRNYDFFNDYLDNNPSQLGYTQAERDAANTRSQEPDAAHETLDIALLIDTTGSMGDEIAYLQAEFSALSSRIDDLYPNAHQRWALVVYRDDTDAYVTRSFDFTDDLGAFNADLLDQDAAGGGDFPEAAHRGLADAMTLSWRSDDAARLLFWVGDAPHHDGTEAMVANAVRSAADNDIHIYPVGASGVDQLTELSMRSAAQLTLGRYLFLTDDSGVGNPHMEPTLPCYFVTRLDDAILRMVDIEMKGLYREPLEENIVRTGGDPENGRCQLASGDDVLAF